MTPPTDLHPSSTRVLPPQLYYPNISIRFDHPPVASSSTTPATTNPTSTSKKDRKNKAKNPPAPKPRAPNPLPDWFDIPTDPIPVFYGRGYHPFAEEESNAATGPSHSEAGGKSEGESTKSKKKRKLSGKESKSGGASGSAPTRSALIVNHPIETNSDSLIESEEPSDPLPGTSMTTTTKKKKNKSKRLRLIDVPRPDSLPARPGPGLALMPSLGGGVGNEDHVGLEYGRFENGAMEGEVESGSRKISKMPKSKSKSKSKSKRSLQPKDGDPSLSRTAYPLLPSPERASNIVPTPNKPYHPGLAILRPKKMSEEMPCSLKRKIWAREVGGEERREGKRVRFVEEGGRGNERLRSGMRVLVDLVGEAEEERDQTQDQMQVEPATGVDSQTQPMTGIENGQGSFTGGPPSIANVPTPYSNTAKPSKNAKLKHIEILPLVADPEMIGRARDRLKLSVRMAESGSEVERRMGRGMKVCKYWARGFCKDSVDCTYLHPIPDRPFEKWLVPIPTYITRALADQKRRRQINERRVEAQRVERMLREGRLSEVNAGNSEIRRAPMEFGKRYAAEEMNRLPADAELDAGSDDVPDDDEDEDDAGSDDDSMDFDSDATSDLSDEDGGEFEMDTDEHFHALLNGVACARDGSEELTSSFEMDTDEHFQDLLNSVAHAKDGSEDLPSPFEMDRHEHSQDLLHAGDQSEDLQEAVDPAAAEPEDGQTITHAETAPTTDENPTTAPTVIYFRSGGPGGGPFATRLPNDYTRDPRFNESLIKPSPGHPIDEDLFIKCVVCREDPEDWFFSTERGKKKPGQAKGRSRKTLQIYPSCGHSMCNSCMRQDRHPGKPKKKTAAPVKSTKCPQCRKTSLYTFPTNLGVRESGSTSDRMKECIENYKDYMKQKPCKYVLQTTKPNRKPFCPFGDDCFYKHEVRGKPYRFKQGVDKMMKLYKTNRNNRHERAARRAARLRRFGRNLSTRLNKFWKIINVEIYHRHRWRTYDRPGKTYTGRIAIDEACEMPSGEVVLSRLRTGKKTEFADKLKKSLELERFDLEAKPDLAMRRTVLEHLVAIVYFKWPTKLPETLANPVQAARSTRATAAVAGNAIAPGA